MELKIQVILRDATAEKFADSMRRNHRSMAGEALYHIERDLEREASKEG